MEKEQRSPQSEVPPKVDEGESSDPSTSSGSPRAESKGDKARLGVERSASRRDGEEKTLLEWEAPERAFTKRGKKYFQNLFAILFILAAMAIFFKEFLLAGLLLAIGFLQYVLGTVPPVGMKHQITNRAVKTHGRTYPWEELKEFWFSEGTDGSVLNIDTKHFFPGRLFLHLKGVGKKEAASVLSKFIPEREQPPEDFVVRLSSEVSRRVKLE